MKRYQICRQCLLPLSCNICISVINSHALNTVNQFLDRRLISFGLLNNLTSAGIYYTENHQ